MHEDATATVKTLLDERVTCGEVLHDIFIVDVVNLDGEMLVGRKKVLV